jgi:cob(I)alamin adenosyltransferase
MKIYTKTGDDGTTGLFGGGRVAKASPRVEAYGTVDELNAVLGVVLAVSPSAFTKEVLTPIQSELFTIGAELACEPGKEDKLRMNLVGANEATRLEQAIDQAELSLKPLSSFVLPGGTLASAQLHIARTVCRRAERRVLATETETRREVVIYLNRLSDLLFTLARYENELAAIPDVPWSPTRS